MIAAAFGLTGVRLLLSELEDYKSNLATSISGFIGSPVKIGRLGTNMRGFTPQLVLKDIDISTRAVPARPPSGATRANPLQADFSSVVADEKPAIQLNEIRLSINLLDMLISRDMLSSSRVTVIGAKLAIKRKQDGSIVILGLNVSEGQPQWLLRGGKYEVLQSEIIWQDEKNNSRPLLFDAVDLVIINDGEHHRINMLTKLPKKYGDTLRVSMDFEGNAFEPPTTQGTVYIEGENINLPELAAVDLPLNMNITSGMGNLKVWSNWQHSQLVSVDGVAQLQQMKLIRQDKSEFPVKQLKTRFHWNLNDTQWRLDVKDFELETTDTIDSSTLKGITKKWPSAVFSVSGQRTEDNVLHKIGLSVESVDLQEASAIAQFFAPLSKEQLNLLAQAALKGSLENFSLFADLDTKSVAVNGRFAKISVASLFEIPGIENLSGQIKGSDKQGVVRLETKDAQITSQGLFRAPLPVNSLKGVVAWQQTENNWTVSSQMVELDSLGFHSKSRLNINIPKTKDLVFMDLQSSFVGDNASQAIHYLPVGIMDDEVVAWLDHAVVSGRVTNGGLLVYGNLRDFPFTGGQGVFEAVFNADQVELAYDPQWPHITDMGAEVLFLQDSLKVNVHQGQSDKVIIKQAEVTIPALDDSKHVLIQGEAEGEIGQVLSFMQQTPLSSPVDSLLESIIPEGNTRVTLDLKIPLYENVPTKVDGTAQLKDAKLIVKSLDLAVNKIDGELKFNEQGVYSDTIHAAALGNPIQINIKSTDNQTIVNVAGRAGVSDLKSQFKMPWWDKFEGAADYQLKLRLPYDDGLPELIVESTLAGMALDLPGELAKTKDQQRPLTMGVSLADKLVMPVVLNYDDKLKAAVQLNTKQQKIYSGHILVGTGDVTQSQEAGLKLEINRDQLVLQDLVGFSLAHDMDNGASDRASPRLSSSIRTILGDISEIKIHSNYALWKNTPIGVFDLTLNREGSFWIGDIGSSFAKGKVQIPDDFTGSDRIILDMEVLDISALKHVKSQGDAREPGLSPDLLPLFNVISHKTLWQSVDLGRLTLETERIPGGMGFKNLVLTGAGLKLALTGGDWKAGGGQSKTHTEGRLELARTGEFLKQLGITKDMTETSAVVDFAVNWDAAPYQFSLAALKGRVEVNLNNGRILSIEPGFGRVLGMLAMAQWIKRAQLDFSDVYKEGLTFDSIKGHFDLLNGIASTHDLVVDAIPAKITINGDTDLINQTVDHIVDVTPKSADAVPIAGTIMGKVAALIGRSLTGKNQEGFFFGSQYLVKGSWGNAEIIPMHKNDGVLQKTWNSITSFPWLQQQEEQ
ncbi:MAG: YhdP family protein [Methylobacter sp.]|nr:YhdP family protein [Methylobacter sp.]